MINVSPEYRKACKSPTRKSYFVIKYGLYNKKAKTSIQNVSGNAQPFSSIQETYDEVKQSNINYISCEPNRVKLNNSFVFVSNKNRESSKELIGYWSQDMSNANCYFSSDPTITYIFNDYIEFTALTLSFQEVIENFIVKYYNDDILIYTRTISNNSNLVVETTNTDETNLPAYFNKLEIIFVKTKEPNRYVKFNEVDFGVYQKFEKDEIKLLDIIDELSIDSRELSSNSINVTINDIDGNYDILNPYNKLKLLRERQELSCYHYLRVGNEYQEVPLGTFLLKTISTENNALILEGYDDTYFMNKIYYGSKFYTNVSCFTIFKDIFDYFNYSANKYLIEDELENIKLTGYIPQVEMKEALRMVAEASGCVINKTRYGITHIFKTSYNNSVKTFGTSEISSARPQRNLYDNVIDITAYNYDTLSNEEEKLYSGTLDKQEIIITFNKYPLNYEKYKNNISALKGNDEDFDILEISATSCRIRVNQDNTKVILKGQYYVLDKAVIRAKKDEDVVVDDYAITKVDNTLITNSNAQNIANWKLSRRNIKFDFDCMLTPYIEVGDNCRYVTNYKTLNGEKVIRDFTPTYLNFTNSIKQTIEGE